MKKLILFVFALFCANVLSAQIPAGTRLYLEPAIWNVDNVRFAAYFFGDSGDAWVSMNPVSGTDYYEAITPAGTWSNVIFIRMDGEAPANIWDNRWNQTDNLEYNGTNNLFTVNAWHGGANNNSQGVWSLFVGNNEPSVSLTVPTSVILGEVITLSASSANIENSVFNFSVKTPESTSFVTITSPYTPATVGVYTFRVEAASTGNPNAVLATAEGEVEVLNRIPVGTMLYLNPTELWNVDGARFAAYFFGVGETWIDMTAVTETEYYEAITPAGIWSNVIFVRMDGGTSANIWENSWNQTTDLEYDGVNNLFTIIDFPPYENASSPGVWSFLEPSVSFIVPTSIILGETITLSTTSINIGNPVFSFSVRTPGSTNFVAITSPYTPSTVGVYTFRVEAASTGNPNAVLATAEREVEVLNRIPAGTKLYLNPAIWNVDGARFAAYFFGVGETWVDMTAVAETEYYEAITPAGIWSNVIFVRMDGGTSANIWENSWNQTTDLEYDGVNNLFTITDFPPYENASSPGVWSFLEPSVTLIVPSSVIFGLASVPLSATSVNIETPIFTFFVRTPGSTNFVETTSPFILALPSFGTYTFRVEAASINNPNIVLATDERDVEVFDNISPGTVLYLNPTELWDVDGARFAAYFFGVGEAWVDMTAVPETDYYQVITPQRTMPPPPGTGTGAWSHVIFVRMDGGNSENIWENSWNQTDDLTYDSNYNLFTITNLPPSANSEGVWSFVSPSVTLNVPSMVYLGTEINLSATVRLIENPVYTFFVRTPESTEFVEVTLPYYIPATVGTYTFRVEVYQRPGYISDEREVTVREFELGNGITIGVRKPSDWENIAIHYWTDAMSAGAWAIPVLREDDFYVYTFENEDEINFIFVNGTEWSTSDNQTFGITRIDTSMCFEILDATYDGNTRGVRSIDCPFMDDDDCCPTSVITINENNVIFYVANGILNVNFDGLAQIELFTINGQLIKSQQAQSHFSTHLQRGMYLLRVNGEVHKVMVN